MKTTLEQIKNLNINRHFVSEEQIKEITKLLNLENMNKNELTAIRNKVVKGFYELEDEQEDFLKRMEYYTAMSGTTAVIDNILFKNGWLY